MVNSVNERIKYPTVIVQLNFLFVKEVAIAKKIYKSAKYANG